MANDDLVTACREIGSLAQMADWATDLTAEDLATEQYTMLENFETFSEKRINELCDALREKIRSGSI